MIGLKCFDQPYAVTPCIRAVLATGTFHRSRSDQYVLVSYFPLWFGLEGIAFFASCPKPLLSVAVKLLLSAPEVAAFWWWCSVILVFRKYFIWEERHYANHLLKQTTSCEVININGTTLINPS